ncbi:hypothetical protein F511_21793 [Dorcoceras hygrometricum]|uniref:Oxidative stress 3 n=1 Tax=Dorcoceras hygrometricum TaxID=472368 RepID=A0A2Z7BRF2_9LAMI|nr:hypothetical protein F511_21793 [Dorcoceras hygrometricum]
MAEGKIHRFSGDPSFQNRDHIKNIDRDPSTSSIGEDSLSDESESFSSSCDTTDDASSSNSSRSTSYDFSELMAQLPVKKGLSKFYEGKSESFTSLSRVTSVEDMAKKTATPYTRKLKASKSCATGLNLYKPYTLFRPTISKKSTEPSPSSTGTSRNKQRAA